MSAAPMPALTPNDFYDKIVPANEQFKEFPNLLNEYYLKVGYKSEDKLQLICYNIVLLDNIRYEAKTTINELHQLCSAFMPYKNMSQLFEVIVKLIENGKFEIQKESKHINFILIITDMFSNVIKASIRLQDKNDGKRDEFLNVLSKEIINLRKQRDELEEIKKDQNDIKKDILELKNML